MMTQTDMDAMDKLREVVKYGTVLAQHPRDTNLRFWAQGAEFALWLYPGECLLDHEGKLYVVGMRDA
jgi:hypothetical protein